MPAVASVLVGMIWIGIVRAPAADPSPPLIAVAHVGEGSDAYTALLTHGPRLSVVITTNYSLTDATGRLRGRHDSQLVKLAHRLGIEVHFRVANYSRGRFSRDVAHAVLTSRVPRARAIAGILRILDTYDYDGVSIDLENIPSGHRTALTAFVADLGTEIHRRGKKLSIAVPGRAEDEPSYEWSSAFDLAALGRICDFVILMAYDHHIGTSGAGPVAPFPWVQAVTQYATSRVAREKILLGVAFYGYSWPRRGSGIPISMRRATHGAAAAGVQILWDEGSDTPYYHTRYRTVYFENAQSIELKLALAADEQLAGIAMWRLGLEDPAVWEIMGTYVGRGQQPPLASDRRPSPFGSVGNTVTGNE